MERGLSSTLKKNDDETNCRKAIDDERADETKFKEFRILNAKAVSFILDRLTPKISLRVKNYTTTLQIIESLDTLYSSKSDVDKTLHEKNCTLCPIPEAETSRASK